MSDFLAAMASSSRDRATEARSRRAELETRARSAPPPRPLDVDGSGFDLIAEPKPASPSEGVFLDGSDPAQAVLDLSRGFATAGAVAISVLTEPTQFGGSLNHLEAVALEVGLPVMRKDFLTDPLQVLEARAAGASGVLVLARLCTRSLLDEMVGLARALGMFVVVEVFDEADLEEASVVFDQEILIGVNTRDLATLEVDQTRLSSLAPIIPAHLPAVAESGITLPEHAAEAARLGYRMMLVGTGLVTSHDPSAAARDLLAAGRSLLR
ncbi:MAG: indole-3-glycerol-phosphate synthase [Acidimicrobiia bacterium]